jgi:2-C-methyl-D-erythritol 4-phosphate cytidylyltransferase/2-C-methyl-D-erythritol 4-phosphate cytidylyltransferase/2-C-methyl-D-erythritol 2,4-cyclodiphosphate synthase
MTAAVICAAGASSRMGGVKKEYQVLESGGLTVLGAAVRAFAELPEIALIVIVIPPEGSGTGEEDARRALPRLREDAAPPLYLVTGGASRRESVHRGLSFLLPHKPSRVLIHDGARPWVSGELIRRVIAAVRSHGAAVPLLPLAETPKEIDGSGFVIRHLKRSSLAGAQTPQGFAFPQILQAHEKAAEREKAGVEYTDDAEVWGEFIGKVAGVSGERGNKKITFPEDLALP